MKLIDKDALVAEIEKHLEYANNGILYAQTGIEKGLKKYERDLNAWQHCQNMCKNILSFIDGLEVKELDLEKEIYIAMPSKYCWSGDGKAVYSKEQMRNFAKKFFELGLKAQKGK